MKSSHLSKYSLLTCIRALRKNALASQLITATMIRVLAQSLRIFSLCEEVIREPIKPIVIAYKRIEACQNPLLVCADLRRPLIRSWLGANHGNEAIVKCADQTLDSGISDTSLQIAWKPFRVSLFSVSFQTLFGILALLIH